MPDRLLSGDVGRLVVPAVLSGISNTRGDEFFQALSQRLSLAVGADFLLIGSLQDANTRARTITVCENHRIIDNFVYELEGTPCERVASEASKLHSSGVQDEFPQDQMLVDMGAQGYYGTPLFRSDGRVMGLLVGMFKNAVTDPERVESIFNLFAGRIAAEMENTEKTDALITLNRALEQRVIERTKALEAAKMRAEEANMAKTVFLAVMSHEIRTPLNGVLGMAELLEGTGLEEQQSEYLGALRQSGSALMSIVNDILDYTRIFSGELELDPVVFDMEEWLQSVVTPFYATVPAHLKLNLTIEPEVAGLYNADKNRLQQVITNLLGNATKFTHEGSIHLRASKIRDEQGQRLVRFAVTDTGIGVSNANQTRIFDPFLQADTSSTREYGGTGLGLSICKKIVTTMGGEIRVDSVTGEGSCFHFVVPLNLELHAENALAPNREEQQYPGLKVLLVEDNPVNQFLTVAQLEQLGMEAEVVGDGLEAIDLLCEQKKQFDLVLMDCEMPGMDGFEATKNIRAWESQQGYRPMPIYALTAHVLAENNDACAAVGMNGRLTKPIKIPDYYPVLNMVANRTVVSQ
ncbi:MAG: ATP-binding protein [Halioglobus sp.]